MSQGARRARLIANPAARGDTGVAEETLAMVSAAPGWEATVDSTEMRGHAVLLAEEAVAAGVDLVLSIGGDGTAREVAAGLASTQTAMGIVPAGTGNSSYKVLFGDADWREVVARALAFPTLTDRRVDLLQVEPTGEYSLLGVSVGWFAQIVELAEADSSQSGPGKYAMAALQAATDPVRFTAQVELDGSTLAEGDLGLVALGGSRIRASVFPVLPRSIMDDGLLDVMAVTAAEPAEFNEMLQLVMTESHLDHRLVRYGQGKSVTVRSGAPLPIEIDGDLWDRHLGETTISVVPHALWVLGAA